MCDVDLPLSYVSIAIHPSSNPGIGGDYLGSMTFLMATLAALLLIGHMVLRMHENFVRHSSHKRASAIMAALCTLLVLSGSAYADALPELHVCGPHDEIISDGLIKRISENYSNQYNVPVNITCVNGRKALLKMLSDKDSKADVVILEEDYPLYNLTGMKALMKMGLIEDYSYLYSERALMITRAGLGITSSDDLNGKRVAVTDQHMPGGCLARDIVNATGLNITKVSVQSTSAQLDAVVDGTADATILWENIFKSNSKSSSDQIETIDLPEYKMDNFIAALKATPEKEKAERYIDYLQKALSENERQAQSTFSAALKAEA